VLIADTATVPATREDDGEAAADDRGRHRDPGDAGEGHLPAQQGLVDVAARREQHGRRHGAEDVDGAGLVQQGSEERAGDGERAGQHDADGEVDDEHGAEQAVGDDRSLDDRHPRAEVLEEVQEHHDDHRRRQEPEVGRLQEPGQDD
jgi:hypothetical protein